MVAHSLNLSTLGGRDRWISELKAILVYRVSSGATQGNPVLNNNLKINKFLYKNKNT